MSDEPMVPLAGDGDIQAKIFTLRGQQVMLDRDLAALYGVTTGTLNQAVKRNAERFPERFMFQMSSEEFANWKSQSVISNSADGCLGLQNVTSYLGESTIRMGLRKRPFAFTEHGVTMLAAVLRSRTAVRVSLGIIDAFVAMRRTLASMGQVLTRLETVERRQITDQSRNEARFDAIFAKMGEGEIPLSQIFCHDRFVIIDNVELYSIGASLKDAGRLTFGVTRMGAAAIPGLLENLRKATSSRVVYGK